MQTLARQTLAMQTFAVQTLAMQTFAVQTLSMQTFRELLHGLEAPYQSWGGNLFSPLMGKILFLCQLIGNFDGGNEKQTRDIAA